MTSNLGAHRAHNPEYAGSSPVPATKSFYYFKENQTMSKTIRCGICNQIKKTNDLKQVSYFVITEDDKLMFERSLTLACPECVKLKERYKAAGKVC